ncbi:hypothetical protein SAMN06264365_13814 [Actinoplanes regularis]|uniref:Uncharacterized protein n=1 Tax=Actinoplanes regularis TaxID=52697 RepID=A0A239JU99_9ACTN|nr:hypothetical protein SAMN06264365_13814 [Actinoplanes regularis]
MEPLSAGTEYRCDAMRQGSLRVHREGRLETDVTYPIETAITCIDARTRLHLTGELLEARMYLLVTVPTV